MSSYRANYHQMSDYQWIKLLELLENETDLTQDELEEYEEPHLQAWASDLGFDWDEYTQKYEYNG